MLPTCFAHSLDRPISRSVIDADDDDDGDDDADDDDGDDDDDDDDDEVWKS